MNHLQVETPNVHCLRMGKPFAVTTNQFNDWFTDNQSAEIISKETYLDARELQLQKGKTICLSTYCNQELTIHDNGYCADCVDFQKMEYEN